MIIKLHHDYGDESLTYNMCTCPVHPKVGSKLLRYKLKMRALFSLPENYLIYKKTVPTYPDHA